MRDELLAELKQACVAHGQSVFFYPADVTDPLGMDSAMGLAHLHQGPADLAFNCAGLMRNAVFTELPFETFVQVINVNLIGSRNFAASALKHMAPQGHLVFMASLAIPGVHTQAAYAASKFGVVGLAEVLRAEQKLQGIDVSVVCPGEIQTPLLDYERESMAVNVTRQLNAVAGVLTVDQAVAGILRGVQHRQFHDHAWLQSQSDPRRGAQMQHAATLDRRSQSGQEFSCQTPLGSAALIPFTHRTLRHECILESIPHFDDSRAAARQQARVEDTRIAAQQFRQHMLNGPKVRYFESFDLITVPYPVRYGLRNAFSRERFVEYMHIQNRLFVVQFDTRVGLKTLLVSPSDHKRNIETPFFRRFAGSHRCLVDQIDHQTPKQRAANL